MSGRSVGFIGAGSMGGPMVVRLLAAGHEVHLYARRDEVARQYAELGATISASPAAAVTAGDVAIICPYDTDQLRELLLGDGGLIDAAASGTVIVQHATVAAADIIELAAVAMERGVTVLDAPISGTSDAVRAGQLTVLLGGPGGAVETVSPLLSAYAATIVPTGETGTASRTKLVNNLVFAAHAQVAGAALQLGSNLGIDEAQLLAAVTACSADSFAMRTMLQVGSAESFAQYAAPYLKKDVALIGSEMAAMGLDTGLLGRIVSEGHFDLT